MIRFWYGRIRSPAADTPVFVGNHIRTNLCGNAPRAPLWSNELARLENASVHRRSELDRSGACQTTDIGYGRPTDKLNPEEGAERAGALG